MKANRKFRNDEDAVSPVIAVILMVAITVVLAATIYVWVSGFGASGSQADSAALSVVSSTGGVVTLQMVSVSPTANWNSLKVVVDGMNSGATHGIYVKAATCTSFVDSGTAAAWDGTARLSSTKCPASAGDIIRVGTSATPTGTVQIRLVDTAANTVLTQVTLSGLTGQSAVTTAVPTCVAGSTITFGGTYYSKTGTDTAAIQASDLARTTAITTLTHAAGASTATVSVDNQAGDQINAVANRLYTIAGAAVGNTASAAC